MARLFSPFKLRGSTFRNHIFVSPMCQYSAAEGVPNEWRMVHLGSRAVGGAALVAAEASAVSPEGRISPCDLGIWNDEQAQAEQIVATELADVVLLARERLRDPYWPLHAARASRGRALAAAVCTRQVDVTGSSTANGICSNADIRSG